MMKKTILLPAVGLVLISSLTGCTPKEPKETKSPATEAVLSSPAITGYLTEDPENGLRFLAV